MSHLIPFWTPHEHIEIWDCKCGANRHCNLCGVSTSTVPCDCDRNNPCSFYYDHKYDVLCSHCGFSIPKGEEYDPENPLCEGCQDWEEDEDQEQEKEQDSRGVVSASFSASNKVYEVENSPYPGPGVPPIAAWSRSSMR